MEYQPQRKMLMVVRGLRRTIATSLLLAGAMLLQGCLAGAWVAVVGLDWWGRADEVIFAPFEHSWVALGGSEEDSTGATTVASIGVLPFEGDVDMGPRVATVLQQETRLRVEHVAEQSGRVEVSAVQQAASNESPREAMAKMLSSEAHVDAVLFGRVEGTPQHPSDWGWSERESRRMYLQLIDRNGHLLWSDELPYTVVKGSAPPPEDRVQLDLAGQMVKQIEALQLDELGYLPKKLAS